ncbi:protein-export chaperone SecB [candidate division WOR-3 bacterium]|nr:protein-export chaperone SecB [candidate division WOR-3 bacterium]
MSDNQPPLQLSNYFVEKLEYEALPGFDPRKPGAEELTVDPDIYPVPDRPHEFMVRLRVRLAGPAKSNSRCRLGFSLVGFFAVGADADDKLKNEMVFVNAPLILFGIARQVAAEVTANGPYGKVILRTVNFTEVFRRKAAAATPPAAAEFKVSDKPAQGASRSKGKE